MPLNIAHIEADVFTLGPGRRVALWVQGCLRDCPGCLSPEWQPLAPSTILAPGELAERILAGSQFDGLTFSGGEPMLQAAGLLKLWSIICSARPLANLILFSGFTSSEIESEGNIQRTQLLHSAHAFIGGPYIQELDDGLGLRGSSNKEVLFSKPSPFTKSEQDDIASASRSIEIRLRSQAGQSFMVGVPSAEALAAIHHFPASHPNTKDSQCNQ